MQKELRDHRERLGERSAEVRDSLVGSIAVHPVNIHALANRNFVPGTRRRTGRIGPCVGVPSSPRHSGELPIVSLV